MYLLLKALHIFGFVAWFAGLFFLVRLFVYHTEAFAFEDQKKSILRKEYEKIELKVYRIICNPAMMLTWLCGIGMIVSNGFEWFSLNHWLHFKIVLVICLTIYHLHCKTLIRKLQKGPTLFSSFQFRLWNELPSILLLAIVLLAVYKNSIDFLKAGGGVILFAVVIFAIAKAYKKHRLKTENLSS